MNIQEDDLDLRTAYELLGLKSSATLPEIRSAYLTLVRLYHPDKQPSRFPSASLSSLSGSDPAPGGGEQDAGGSDPLIVRLNEAYATLATPEGRAAYDARLLADRCSSAVAAGTASSSSSSTRISATVELDDFEVKHVDEVEGGNQFASTDRISRTAGSRAQGLLPSDGGNDEGHSDDDEVQDEEESGSSPIVFVYPCRCGHAFVVHPDELLSTATTSDTTDGTANLTTELKQSHVSSNTDEDEKKPNQSESSTSLAPSMSMLSTCSGCSQVIKVVWGQSEDIDEDDGTREKGNDEDVQKQERSEIAT
ncbi:unnamed protein product [Tilletia laevis]|uniref:Uncharacterized protein n=2 Tax=Tilletia TaxID=13289 RepID=A0A9N8LXV4_9BASI|nr:hypothetical protein CF335_g4854 [Tilletia laevis]KAE8257440.1 hypothetical protein A4X03_0g4664 [Tilletia caries]CAD6887958.1 unnamed protein product [Tilletia caries]CAD6934283.1 unnamed protein product [Tilletia caries]CAD6948664.1 unnamed protein product [Tilletia laevis]